MQFLAWVEWNYNTSHHTFVKFAPFKLVYGYPPPYATCYEKCTTKLETVEHGLLERDRLFAMLKTNLEVAQNRMRVQANIHRIEREFVIGDYMYLR